MQEMCWEVPHPKSPKSWVWQRFIYLFEPSTYQLKHLGWYMVSYMVSERVSIPLFLCSPHGRPVHEICWVCTWGGVPHPTLPKPWVWYSFINLFGPSTYQLKLLGWYMVSYKMNVKLKTTILHRCPSTQFLHG